MRGATVFMAVVLASSLYRCTVLKTRLILIEVGVLPQMKDCSDVHCRATPPALAVLIPLTVTGRTPPHVEHLIAGCVVFTQTAVSNNTVLASMNNREIVNLINFMLGSFQL